jgi:TPR repeat protein
VKAAGFEKLAADQGHSDAQNHYGWRLETGVGAIKDVAQAAVYYKRAADQGVAGAQESYRRCTSANPPSPQ